jgi:hypothetical protein
MRDVFRWMLAFAVAIGAGALPPDGWSANSQIEAIVEEAVTRNSSVIAAREHYEAQGKMPIQAATLPDPEVSLQQLTVGGPKPFEGSETSYFFYTGFGATQAKSLSKSSIEGVADSAASMVSASLDRHHHARRAARQNRSRTDGAE